MTGIISTVAATLLGVADIKLSPLEDALWCVETSRQVGPIKGDGGRALGPLQIHYACWFDAVEHDPSIGGTYEDCKDLEYSIKIHRAYLSRYCKSSRLPFNRKVTDEDRAKCWNGGPSWFRAKGKKLENLNRYWSKVKEVLK